MPRIFPVLDKMLAEQPRIEKGHAGTPLPGSPGAPTGLYAQVLGDRTIQINWYPPSDGTQKGYDLYRYDDIGSPEFKQRIDAPDSVSYIDNAPTPGVTYEYYVFAFNDYGEGPEAGPVTAMVPVPPPPTAPNPPENLTALAGDTDIYASWNAVADAASYVLYRNLSPDLSMALLLANPTGTSYTDTDVLAGHTYYYWVAARNEVGDSDAIGPATATLPETVPEPIPEPTPPEEGFAPGDNIRRIMEIVRKRLDEIQKDKAAGKWPPWGWP